MKKKSIFKLKTFKSFIICSLHWHTRQFQVSTLHFRAFCPSIKSLSTQPMLCHSSSVCGIPSKPSSPMSEIIKPILLIWSLSCKSCRKPTAKPKNWDNKRPTTIKKSIRFFTIRAYRLYSKPFKRSWLAVTIIIFWPAILVLKRLANCWPKNITGQPSATMSKPMWKAVIFV